MPIFGVAVRGVENGWLENLEFAASFQFWEKASNDLLRIT